MEILGRKRTKAAAGNDGYARESVHEDQKERKRHHRKNRAFERAEIKGKLKKKRKWTHTAERIGDFFANQGITTI